MVIEAKYEDGVFRPLGEIKLKEGTVVEIHVNRDVRRLVAQYGGRTSKWMKKSSPRGEIAGKYFEFHWYEHPGIGRFEVKQVRVNRS